MRIALIDPIANVGGGRRFTSSLLEALVAVCPDWEFRLVTSREALQHNWIGQHRSLPIESVGLITEETLKTWLPARRIAKVPGSWRLSNLTRVTLLRTAFRFERQLQRVLRGVDIAFFSSANSREFGACDVPVVLTIHDMLWKRIHALTERDQATVEAVMPRWLGESAAVITGTRFMRSDIEHFYPGLARRIEVIYYSAPDLPAPLDEPQRGELMRGWNIRRPFVLCAAGPWPHKNHANLIRAFARLKDHPLQPMLVCTGLYTDHAFGTMTPEPLWEGAVELRRLAEEVAVRFGRDVIGLGHVSDRELSTLYAEAGCVVLPAVYEGGSLPILEAVVQGAPIAWSDIPVYRELEDFYHISSAHFDPADPQSIAAALETQLVSPPLAEMRAENARRVRARTWRHAAAEYRQVFESVR